MQVGSTRGITSYRDLIAWQKAMNLVVRSYEEASKLSAAERYGLGAQIRRCAVSIPANIAEGWGRRSTGEYVRFLKIARASTFELLTHAEVSQRLGLTGDWISIRTIANEVAKLLNALISSLVSGRQTKGL